MSDNNNKTSPADSEKALVCHLLDYGLVDQVELDECIQAQKTITDRNEQTSLAGMLVARGYLTAKQAQRI